ncbi:hypothetical protein CEXT_123961 [Caerostris extrusa]|uniref:Uncharacterized protein n=1 Tax=Caerostris extrusa TaxID=172846 RepID=A0AAV4RFA8_CAEEX|nr:hypothetical protein CEXT_123961 [Caerostris extrusa]
MNGTRYKRGGIRFPPEFHKSPILSEYPIFLSTKEPIQNDGLLITLAHQFVFVHLSTSVLFTLYTKEVQFRSEQGEREWAFGRAEMMESPQKEGGNSNRTMMDDCRFLSSYTPQSISIAFFLRAAPRPTALSSAGMVSFMCI